MRFTLCVLLAAAEARPHMSENTVSSLVSWPRMPHAFDVAAVQQSAGSVVSVPSWNDVAVLAPKHKVHVAHAPIRSRLEVDGANFADDLASALAPESDDDTRGVLDPVLAQKDSAL